MAWSEPEGDGRMARRADAITVTGRATRPDPDEIGTTRLRVITNHLTRMRLVGPAGELDFLYKEDLTDIPPGLHPWFTLPNPALAAGRVLFGHWAAIAGETGDPRFTGLDTGCVWGGRLTACRVADGRLFHSRRGCPGAA